MCYLRKGNSINVNLIIEFLYPMKETVDRDHQAKIAHINGASKDKDKFRTP